jgi:hypothetical protein
VLELLGFLLDLTDPMTCPSLLRLPGLEPLAQDFLVELTHAGLGNRLEAY